MFVTYYIFAVLIFGSIWALPVEKPKDEVVIVKSVFEDEGNGSFHWSFENSDGTKSEQKGYYKDPKAENPIQVLEGSYSYYAPDGVLYSVTYISDENGYRPTGTHLPQ